MIFERFSNLKYKYWNRYFWGRKYYVDTVGKNKKAIELYITKIRKDDSESNKFKRT